MQKLEIVFEAASPHQKHPEANYVSPRADQRRREPDAISASIYLFQSLSDFEIDKKCEAKASLFL